MVTYSCGMVTWWHDVNVHMYVTCDLETFKPKTYMCCVQVQRTSHQLCGTLNKHTQMVSIDVKSSSISLATINFAATGDDSGVPALLTVD